MEKSVPCMKRPRGSGLEGFSGSGISVFRFSAFFSDF